MGFVEDAFNTVFGGEQKAAVYNSFTPITEEEKARLAEIEGEIKKLYSRGTTSKGPQEMQDLFRKHILQFVQKDYGTNPTPEQMAEATSFVDSTFTKPAQEALSQQQGDFESQMSARAAALGRNPNVDIATQQAMLGEAMRGQRGLMQERGSRIAQEARGVNQMGYDRALNRLNVGQLGSQQEMQRSSFLNDLSQRAFQNQMNLLNARTGIGQFHQSERGQNGANTMTTNPGLLGGAVAAGNQIAQLGQAYGGISTMMGSDIKLKKNIEETSDEIHQFLDSLVPYKYEYRDSAYGEGTQYSVMAQDLEKTATGRQAVVQTPQGKMVDYAKLMGVILAAQVDLNKRLKAMGV
jgi:hypothetical protein